MSDIKLFSIAGGTAKELTGEAVALEKSLQTLIEANLEALLGVRFLATEYSTGPKHGGRIDSLGIDEDGSPVIIEYKRATNQNVINQGLYYLDWLLDHKGEFQLLVTEKLGVEVAGSIEWSVPRLLCIAGGFTKFDEHAVQQINRNIGLVRYRQFGQELLLFELVNKSSVEDGAAPSTTTSSPGATSYKTIADTLGELDGPLLDLYEELRAFLTSMGDDVSEKTLKFYVAFKRLKNFACVEVHPNKKCLTVFVKVNPDEIQLEPGFTRDVRQVGHYGTGDLEITLRTRADLEKAADLLHKSYEAS